jgi:hypothetical protein
MKYFYARTANTGFTRLLFCVMTQYGQPALFVQVEGIKREAEDLYVQFMTGGVPYRRDNIVGITEAEKIIEKYDLTSFPE